MKISILIILLPLSFNSFSQTIYVPDDAFEAYLEGNIPGAYNGAYNDNYISSTINTFLPYTVVLDGATNPVTDLTGIEFLSNCRLLYLTNIAIPNLDLTGLLAPNIEIHASPLVLNIILPEIIIGHLDIDGNSQLTNIIFQENTRFSPLPNSNIAGMLFVYIQNNPSLVNFDMSSVELLGGNSVLNIINNSNLTCANIANGNCALWLQVIVSNNPVLDCIQVDSPNYSSTNGNWLWVYMGNNISNYSTNCGCVASIGEEKVDEISLFPNPTTSKFIVEGIEGMVDMTGTSYYLLDQIGNMIQSGTVDAEKMEIDLSRFAEGVYWLKFDNSLLPVQKIIKQ